MNNGKGKMGILYSNKLPEKDEYFKLFESTGWNEKYQLDKNRLYDSLKHSWYLISAYDDDELVGFGRILSDGILHGLIVDLIVLPDFQGKGIGGKILTYLLEKCKSSKICDIQLFCANGKISFYEKYGFLRRSNDAPGMELK